MAASRNRQQTNRRQTTYRKNEAERRNTYIYDNTARELDVRRAMEEAPKKKLSHTARKNREKARHMNLGYVLFLTMALGVTGIILIGYIRLQSDITASVKNISRLESRLSTLKMENDEELSRIESSIDLGEVKRIAMEELGMTYAEEGQIVEYSSEGSDYVRQVAELPGM
ncbi:MAG: cell division protein FtsL [Clostridiales bacterium]|nr:cell division protein FtsL [Clostridiales bacterium]